VRLESSGYRAMQIDIDTSLQAIIQMRDRRDEEGKEE
jgi:hypothetical protein